MLLAHGCLGAPTCLQSWWAISWRIGWGIVWSWRCASPLHVLIGHCCGVPSEGRSHLPATSRPDRPCLGLDWRTVRGGYPTNCWPLVGRYLGWSPVSAPLPPGCTRCAKPPRTSHAPQDNHSQKPKDRPREPSKPPCITPNDPRNNRTLGSWSESPGLHPTTSIGACIPMDRRPHKGTHFTS